MKAVEEEASRAPEVEPKQKVSPGDNDSVAPTNDVPQAEPSAGTGGSGARQDLSESDDFRDDDDLDEEALAGDTIEPWMQEVDLAALARQDLGPSNIKREVMALEAAVEQVPSELRKVLQEELRVTFREVRSYQKG